MVLLMNKNNKNRELKQDLQLPWRLANLNLTETPQGGARLPLSGIYSILPIEIYLEKFGDQVFPSVSGMTGLEFESDHIVQAENYII